MLIIAQFKEELQKRLKNQAFAGSPSFETEVSDDKPAKEELKWGIAEVERMPDSPSEPKFDTAWRQMRHS